MSYQYNNIHLQHCRTLSLGIIQERDPYNVDALWTKYTIRVRGFLTRSAGSFPGIGESLSSAEVLRLVKSRLETPRRSLIYKIANSTIVSVVNTMDAKLGPEPTEAIVTEVTSGVFMVECGCIARVVDCDDLCGGTRSPVLSLRWTQTEAFDESWYSKLSTEGRLIVRSDLLQSADNFRPLATPPLLPDYKRMSARYTLSPDGLELAFNFEDQEVDRLPPGGVVRAEGTYTVTSEKPGYKRLGEVDITLEGIKGSSRKLLLIRALSMAYSKIQADQLLISDANGAYTPPIIWGSAKEDLFRPIVRVSMTAMMTNLNRGSFLPGGVPAAAANSLLSPSLAGPLGILGGVGGAAALGGTLPSGTFSSTGGSIDIGSANGALGRAATNPVTGNPIVGNAATANLSAFSDDNAVAARFAAPGIMPSVGKNTAGLSSNQAGLAPPERMRLAGLLTAAFRDPCACLLTGSEIGYTELRSQGGRTGARNPLMVNLAAGPAIINRGQLPPDRTNGTRLVSDNAPYDTYSYEKTAVYMSGKVMMPGTGTGANGAIAAAATIHGGIMKVYTSWVAGRTGKPPVLPTYLTSDPNLVPLDATIVSSNIVPSADGANLVYMTAGYYVHGVLDPSRYEIVPGTAPFLTADTKQDAKLSTRYWNDLMASVGRAAGQVVKANPFIEGGVTPDIPPANSPGFASGAGLPPGTTQEVALNIIQGFAGAAVDAYSNTPPAGVAPLPTPNANTGGDVSAQLGALGAAGAANVVESYDPQYFFFHPPVRP